jgi:hypothetical protein
MRNTVAVAQQFDDALRPASAISPRVTGSDWRK